MFNPQYNLLPVEAVANRILLEARQRGIDPPTNLMLQKLVYFVQGYALGSLCLLRHAEKKVA